MMVKLNVFSTSNHYNEILTVQNVEICFTFVGTCSMLVASGLYSLCINIIFAYEVNKELTSAKAQTLFV